MSFFGLRRRIAVWLVVAGIGGLGACDVLTDDPLTDSEMTVFLAEAEAHATGSRTKAFRATVKAAAGQRSAIAGAASLERVRAEAAIDAAMLATRVRSVAGELTETESSDLDTKRATLDTALQGEDAGAITAALRDLTQAVASAESAAAARRPAPTPDRVPASTDERTQEESGGGTDTDGSGASQADEPAPQSPSDTPDSTAPDTAPSSPQDSSDSEQGLSAGQQRTQEP